MIQSLYHISDKDIKNMTMKEFYIKQINIKHVAKLYNPYIGGEETDTGSSGIPSNRVGTQADLEQFMKNKKAKAK